MNTVAFPRKSDLRHTLAVDQTVRRTFEVNVENGLHARPCALLVKTIRAYRSTVEVEADGNTASARSLLDLMSLGAGYGSQITFTIVGEDAFQAFAALQHLFDTQFENAYR